MKTIYDVISMIIFAGIAVLYLHRSASEEQDQTALWKYAVAAGGCAVADYLGNHDQVVAAVVVFLALIVFSVVMLQPFKSGPSG
jgi:multidrug transporter EmrE-like cation transporter